MCAVEHSPCLICEKATPGWADGFGRKSLVGCRISWRRLKLLCDIARTGRKAQGAIGCVLL